METKLFAFDERSTHNYAELRNAVLMQGAELEKRRNGLILMESAQTRVQQFGSRAVAELDVLMQAFR